MFKKASSHPPSPPRAEARVFPWQVRSNESRGGTYQASLEPLASITCERIGSLPPVCSDRYIEDVSAARTKLAIFFNILHPATNQRGKIGTVGDVLILLLVLITIGAWWFTQRNKPRTSPSPAPASPVSSIPSPVVVPGQAPLASPTLTAPAPSLAGGQLRAFSPGSIPGSQHAAALDAIHSLIERGQDAEAEARLAALPQDALNNEQVRKAASILWNNLGIVRQQSQGTAAAVPAFKAAVALAPRDQTPRLNLTHAYVETKDQALTRGFLEETIQLAPNDPVAHLALADLLYDKDDLAGAPLSGCSRMRLTGDNAHTIPASTSPTMTTK